MHSKYRSIFLNTVAALLATAAIFSFSNTTFAQATGGQYDTKSDPKTNRIRGLNILGQVQEVLEQMYYDEKFRGINLKERIKAAEETIKKQDMNWQIYRTIAQVLIEFQDSHTRFLPPDRRYRVEYGLTNIMIGDQCFVVDVKKGSDAEKKGLKAGDKITAIGDFPANRNTLSVINYLIYGLDPQENLKLSVVSPDGGSKNLTIASRFLSPKERSEERKKRKKNEQDKPYFCSALGGDVMACKLRTFETEKPSIDKMLKEASSAKKLILDLRGNGGGYVETMLHLVGKFFADDVIVGIELSRRKKREYKADGSGDKAYKGELIVLIDSDSASASEVLSRTMQLEKRGKIVGDTSAGAVMTSLGYGLRTPLYGNTLQYQQYYQVSFISVSVGDLVMKDGNRLEGIGVSPDMPVGPSPHALLSRADPILAYAAELLGSPISAEKAGEMHFLIPKTEDAVDKDAPDDEAGSN